MELNFDINSENFNPGYAIESEDREGLNLTSTRPLMKSFGDLPERVDPRQTDLYKNNWLKVENQGSIGSCLKGNTLITMGDGSQKMIKHIRYGDYVLSHTRTPRRVVDTMSREYSGDMYTFHVKGWNPIETTADHIMLVQRDGENKWVRADEVIEDDLMLISAGVEESSVDRIDLSNFVNDVNLIEEEGMIRTKGSIYSINRFLELTEEACYCIGLYCAEGSCDYSAYGTPFRANFTLHEKEDYISSKIKNWANTLGLPFKKNIKQNSKAVNYRISSGVLASFLKNVCGRFCNKKEVPTFILNASLKHKEAFLKGYLDGDGSFKGQCETLEKSESRILTCNQICASTASKKLQIQLAQLSISMGMKPGLSIKKASDHQNYDNYIMYLYSNDAKNIYNSQQASSDNRHLINTPWGQWRKIRSITKQQVKFLDVYDLTVEKDHSFIAGGVAVHNCAGNALTECGEYSWGIESGNIIQLSRMYAYLRTQQFDGIRGDRGSTLSGGTKCALEGICLEDIAPYPNSYPGFGWLTNAMKENAVNYKLKSHTTLQQEEEVKQYIGSGLGIVQIGIAWGRAMTPDSKGLIKSFSAGGGGHSVTFTGYVPDSDIGIQSTKGYWYLLKNSWGSRWGDNGFAYVDPRAVAQMLGHRWTVFVGRSDMNAPSPRPLHVNFTEKRHSIRR